MQDATPDSKSLTQYWDSIRRRRRSMFVAFVITWAVACAAAWLLPPRYRSEATILIEKPKVPKDYVVPNVESDPQQQLQTLTQQVLSRSRLQRIIDDFHLYSGGLAGLMAGDPVETMRKDITIDQVLTPTKPIQELVGFTISYSSFDPRLAQNVASRLTSLFIEENLQAREQQSESTTEFLDKQLQEARDDLDSQTARLKQFKAQFVGSLPGELQSNLQILNGLQIRLQQANESLNRAEQQKLYLNSMLSAYRDAPSLAITGMPPGSPADAEAQLARLKAELAELRAKYTDKHPEVQQVRDEIVKAEKLKAEIEKDKSGDDTGLPLSRGVAEIKSQLKGTELDIQNRKKEIAGMQSTMQAYEDRLKETPLREQQLADLTKDYDQSRQNYEDLLEKKNGSALATDLEKAAQGQQFALLEPPSSPYSPYFPNRLLTTLGGLVAGLMVAIAFAFIRESLDDRIHADVEVNKIAKVPILVSIPPLTTASEVSTVRWRTIREFVYATVVLVLVTASTVVAFVYG
jgi:polysaccharide biosynthesis transport protein